MPPLAAMHRRLAPLGYESLLRSAMVLVASFAVAHAYVLPIPYGWAALVWPFFALDWLAALVDRERRVPHDRGAGTRIVRA